MENVHLSPTTSKELQTLLHFEQIPSIVLETTRSFVKAFEELHKRKPKFLPMPLGVSSGNYARVSAILPMLNSLAVEWSKYGQVAYHPTQFYYRHIYNNHSLPIRLSEQLTMEHLFFYDREKMETLYKEENTKHTLNAPELLGWVPVFAMSVGTKTNLCYGQVRLSPEITSMENMKEILEILLVMEPIFVKKMGRKAPFAFTDLTLPIISNRKESSEGPVLELDVPIHSDICGNGEITCTAMAKNITNIDARNRFDPNYNKLGLQTREFKPVDLLTLPMEFLRLMADAKSNFDTQKKRLTSYIRPTNKLSDEEVMSIVKEQVLQDIFDRDTHYIAILDKNNEYVGFMNYNTPKREPIELAIFYIAKNARRKGYGSWALKNLIQEVFMNPDSLPVIVLNTIGSNDDLLSFYGKNGFIPYEVDVVFNTGKNKQLADIVVD